MARRGDGGGAGGGKFPRLTVADCVTIALGMGFLVDLVLSVASGGSFTVGGVVAGMSVTALLGHRVGAIRSRRGAAEKAAPDRIAAAASSRCGVSPDEQPDPDLTRLVHAVTPDEGPWCATPKAGDQAALALAILLSWQLEWLALVVQQGLELYQREWEMERSRGTDRVTAAFYGVAQRAWFEMRRTLFDVRYRRLLQDYPGLSTFYERIGRIREDYARSVMDRLLVARGNTAMAEEVQRNAAEKVEQLIEASTDLRQEIGEWQERARAEATALRRRLQVAAGG